MARTADDVERALARVVAGLAAGEVRDGQLQMALAVADVLAGRGAKHLAVAAGTGTGKSLGYLVPAVLSGKRVVVATATLALQDQLSDKDLPIIARTLGRAGGKPVTWAVLKGRANYLCRQQLAEIDRLGEQERLDVGGLGQQDDPSRSSPARVGRRAPRSGRGGARTESTGDQVARLVHWAQSSKTGDRADLDFEPSPAAWGRVSVGPDECPGASRCESGSDCFTEKARAKAALAQVTIVNHHLLGAHLRSEGAVLPEHDVLIVDEAHELEDTLAASLGVDVSPGRLRGLAAGSRAALTSAGVAATSVADELLDGSASLEAVLAESPESRLPQGLGRSLGEAVRLLIFRSQRLVRELRAASGSPGSPPGRTGSSGSEAEQRCLRAQLALERCQEDLELCLSAGDDTVVWVAGGPGERRSLRSAPLDISNELRRLVFAEIPVVLTSATMAPGLAVRLGAPPGDVVELDVGSPFDYRQHGLLYCAAHLPDRRRPGSEEALHDELESLILAAGGRTLALFTSRRAMQAAAAVLRSRVPWPIHMQGDLPKPALVAAFTNEEESCLFATMGYWQGVDVPGATLSLVVIDKIPFPRPDDPLMAARRDAAGEQGFRLVDLPRAATLLAQGAGRLIRTAGDRGVVAVLDPRLARASYSGYLVKALPKMRRTRDRAEAVAFLRGIHSESGMVAAELKGS